MIFERHANLKYKYRSRPFRCRGYYVDTVGKNAKKIEEYIRNQIQKDLEYDQITKGIYQISRNPAFLGFDLVYIGILLMFFNWMLFIVSIFAMIMFHMQIVNVEEDFLLESFGDEYLSYKKKVCRYVGRKR